MINLHISHWLDFFLYWNTYLLITCCASAEAGSFVVLSLTSSTPTNIPTPLKKRTLNHWNCLYIINMLFQVRKHLLKIHFHFLLIATILLLTFLKRVFYMKWSIESFTHDWLNNTLNEFLLQNFRVKPALQNY